MNNINYDNISKALIYKRLHPPYYRIHNFNNNPFIRLSKAMMIRFKVHGKGQITQLFHYDINNNIVNYRCYFYSEEQRQQYMKKNKRNNKKK
jgi:peptide methionine sulfoxide reductase MsrA